MNSATKQVIAMSLIMVVGTTGLIIWFDNRFGTSHVVSQIDGFEYYIQDYNDNYINVSFLFKVTIENYGTLKDVTIPCSRVQNYLQVKNATVPLVSNFTSFEPATSYILNTTYTKSNCDNQQTTVPVSENLVDQIAVAVPFRMVSGVYSFIWYNSVADTFYAAVVTISVYKGGADIAYQLEASSITN